MSIIESVILAYDNERDAYMLLLRTWPTPEDARNWAIENLGVDPYGYPPASTIAERLREHGQLDLPLEDT